MNENSHIPMGIGANGQNALYRASKIWIKNPQGLVNEVVFHLDALKVFVLYVFDTKGHE